MTGYAKVQSSFGNKKLNIEIKTLNSKQLDLIVKVPTAYRAKELDIRAMLSQLERGKVECIFSEETTVTSATTFNADLLAERFTALWQLATKVGASTDTLYSHLVTMGDIWNSSTDNEIDDEEWAVVSSDLQHAINICDQFRSHEGSVLEQDFHKHVDLIEMKLQAIPAIEGERIDTAKERIRRCMAEAVIKEVDENRFEQELIYYLEKLDITEEKVRLCQHCNYFNESCDDDQAGKKLGFIAQEMGREINTLGSKANEVNIQKIVV